MPPELTTTYVQLDKTAALMLEHLRTWEAAEPPAPDPDLHEAYQLAELAAEHYEWERTHQAIRLILQVRLLSLAEEQLTAP